MQIDWLTVVAQIVNFLVLVWLLRRFLYQPVIDAMEHREHLIAARMMEAEQREIEATKVIDKHESAVQSIENDRTRLHETALIEAQEKRQQLLQEARVEVDERRQQWQRQLYSDIDQFVQDLKLEAATAINALTRRILLELANTDFEEQLLSAFINRLAALDPGTRNKINLHSDSAVITTALPMSASEKRRLTRALHETFHSELDIEYKESSELIGGIELTAGGLQIGWSLKDYLEDMSDAVASELRLHSAVTH